MQGEFPLVRLLLRREVPSLDEALDSVDISSEHSEMQRNFPAAVLDLFRLAVLLGQRI